MQEYEYLDSGGRVICRLHDRLRCDECFYVTELREQNKHYRKKIEVALDMSKKGSRDDIRVSNMQYVLNEALEESN